MSLKRSIGSLLPDKIFLQMQFTRRMKSHLNLKDPKTFNEKLQWLKLYDRRPEYTMMVDKYLVRKYIAETIGAEYLVPLLGVWEDPDEIDFNHLPDKFVLKCNHNSGVGLCLCNDKSRLDKNNAKKALWEGFSQDYYLQGREWPYRDIPKKLIAEKLLSGNDGSEVNDFKFHCFSGVPMYCQVIFDRHTDKKVLFYSMTWEKLEIGRRNFSLYKGDFQMPENFSQMKQIASVLSRSIPYVRIDMYNVDGRIYFGEITFFPASGFRPFVPEKWDSIWGEMINLPKPTAENTIG